MLNISSCVAVSSDANSQENTVPATEAASVAEEDVGSGLVGDFVARWWLTWFFEEVCFVNNTGCHLQHLMVKMKSAKRTSV